MVLGRPNERCSRQELALRIVLAVHPSAGEREVDEEAMRGRERRPTRRSRGRDKSRSKNPTERVEPPGAKGLASQAGATRAIPRPGCTCSGFVAPEGAPLPMGDAFD